MAYYLVPAILKLNQDGLYQWVPDVEVYDDYGDINSIEQTCIVKTSETLNYPEVQKIEHIGKMIL